MSGQPMVTFFAIGRLGNLMFEAAACIGYAKKYNVPWGAPRNTREVPRFHEFFPGLPICDQSYRGYQEHPDAFCEAHQRHKDLCHFDYHDIPFQKGGVTLRGFFQSYKYFENAQEEVKRAFRLPHISGYEDYVSIHVRRGDYVDNANSFPPITELYIDMAIYEIKKKRGVDVRNIIWMSDDIQWCKDNFPSLGRITCHYSERTNPFDDLCLMASCGHHIIANSTFSWWGAYLGHNPNRIVVTPSCERGQWFGLESGVKQDCVDLLPPEWVQIKFR